MAFKDSVQKLIAECHSHRHRGVISLCGDKPWVLERLSSVRALYQTPALVVSQDASIAQEHDKSVFYKQYQSILGTQSQLLIWDAYDGLDPDAFSACSGVIEGGGLLILLAPKEQSFLSQTDPSYLAIGEAHEMPLFTRHCLSRFWHKLQSLKLHVFFDQNTGLRTALPEINEPSSSSKTQAEPKALQLNAEQAQCLDDVERVIQGHRKRPLVIKADRGRGKSTTLGYAAAKAIQNNHELRIIVVSTRRDSVEVLLRHFHEQTQDAPEQQEQLEVWAVDALLDKKPKASCIFVDEAASFPLPLLEQLLANYPRLVFASTLHGYEGSGRGFGLKFEELLSKHCDSWRNRELNTPVRWAGNDPLEKLIFDAYALNAELPDLELDAQSNAHSLDKAHSPEIVTWYRGGDLYSDEALANQVFALLVLAHYQTRPGDLRLLLDHPRVHVACLYSSSQSTHLIGAALCIEEGGPALSAHPDINNSDVLSARRRPKGHLVPQSLALFNQDPLWLEAQSLRVMRIAIHPSVRREGLGSRLLTKIKSYAAVQSFDFTSVSFGVSKGLVEFWSKNGFCALRLGYKADAASGAPSLVALAPSLGSTIEKALQLGVLTAQKRFFDHFVYGLARYYQALEPSLVVALLSSCSEQLAPTNQQDKMLSQGFAEGAYQTNDAWPAIEKLLISGLVGNKLDTMNPNEKNLIAMFFLQANSAESCMEKFELKGKKSLEKALRESIQTMLSFL